MTDITRRAALGVAGLGALAALTAGFPRLSGLDIPGRHGNELRVALNGTQQQAAQQAALVKTFEAEHPDIKVVMIPIQATDWGQFFAKILTMVAAGTPPDVVNVATEGAQLFANKLAEPLDSYVQRPADRAAMQDYFSDVHPSLIESFMFKGSLYQLPSNFNAANIFLSNAALHKAGHDYPPDDWTKDDFLAMLRAIKKTSPGAVPFYWTNRMWGGVTPWLYINNTSILHETKSPAGAAEKWLWNGFYRGVAAARGRSGGPLWLHAQATIDPVEETFELLREMVRDGLSSSPASGGGGALVPQFASGRVATTTAGGYWVDGLHQAGVKNDQYDVQFMPKWKSQSHQFGASGWSMMRSSPRKEQAWAWLKFCSTRRGMFLSAPTPTTTPCRRSLCAAKVEIDGVTHPYYAAEGPKHWRVFYETLDRFPGTGPFTAPPSEPAIELALDKNTINAVTGSSRQLRAALRSLQGDLTRALETTS